MSQLHDKLSSLHEKLVEDMIQLLDLREPIYSKELIDGVIVHIDTGLTKSVASTQEKSLMLKLLAQNEIKAEVEHMNTMGKLHKKLAGRRMPELNGD